MSPDPNSFDWIVVSFGIIAVVSALMILAIGTACFLKWLHPAPACPECAEKDRLLAETGETLFNARQLIASMKERLASIGEDGDPFQQVAISVPRCLALEIAERGIEGSYLALINDTLSKHPSARTSA